MRKRIAIPTNEEVLDPHFGHCKEFTFLEVRNDCIQRITRLYTPAHEPGKLPVWLAEKGTTDVIAGSMGRKAMELLEKHGIEVCLHAPEMDPEELTRRFLKGSLICSMEHAGAWQA